MLLDFCKKCLQTNVICSTVSNDGYEITNLTSDSNKGFLAYSCIKPPIHIDFTFICNITLNHVIIWPSVGAQKSSGFELSVKCGNEYKRLSTGFLSSEHSGLLFYRRDSGRNNFDAPLNFLQRYIQLPQGQTLNNAKNLRISILKTENSVPAVGRIEIWGSVSAFCSIETIACIHNLWRCNEAPVVEATAINDTTSLKDDDKNLGNTMEKGIGVPDCFLDPITWNIMIQPIVLPSGAIIDQSTLEKHGKTEATWGRTLSDPFTGLPFNESRKPIIASALKARIDKYLLENKDLPDVKSMPRLSGRKQIVMSMRNRSVDISEISSQNNIVENLSNRGRLKIHKSPKVLEKSSKVIAKPLRSSIQHETRVHRLPIIPMSSSKRVIDKSRSKTFKVNSCVITELKNYVKPVEKGNIEQDVNLDRSVKTVLSNLQRFDDDKKVGSSRCLKNCKCNSKIFYKLPCNHILCRDALMSITDSRCSNCRTEYHSRDLERIHELLTNA